MIGGDEIVIIIGMVIVMVVVVEDEDEEDVRKTIIDYSDPARNPHFRFHSN